MIKYQEISAQKLRHTASIAYSDGHYALLAMFGNDERSINDCFAIYCVFSCGKESEFVVIKALFPGGEPLEYLSLVPMIPAAAWYEREIHDLFGITPLEHPDLRPLVLHENWPQGLYPLRKDFDILTSVPVAKGEYPMNHVHGKGVFEVPVGPIHAGIIEPGHFRFSQAGENMINVDAKLFFTHRGIEKSVEGLSLSMGFYRIERICGACTVSHGISYSQAIESIAGAAIPVRAKYIRVLAAELERLYNHIGDIGNLCAGVGFSVGVSHGARLKELLMRLNELITGNRFLRGLVAPGGVDLDISPKISQEIVAMMDALEPDFQELLQLLRENDAFLDRINHTGILPHQAAVDLSVVGVAARASGINVDARHAYPYGIYNKMDFKTPVYTSGDVAARLWVRADEVSQSVHIIRQVLDTMPYGLIKTGIPAIKPYSSGFGWSESSRGLNLHWVMIGEGNTIYRYFVKSASYSNWPAVTVATPGNIIPDFPLINKSFELCYACLDR